MGMIHRFTVLLSRRQLDGLQGNGWRPEWVGDRWGAAWCKVMGSITEPLALCLHDLPLPVWVLPASCSTGDWDWLKSPPVTDEWFSCSLSGVLVKFPAGPVKNLSTSVARSGSFLPACSFVASSMSSLIPRKAERLCDSSSVSSFCGSVAAFLSVCQLTVTAGNQSAHTPKQQRSSKGYHGYRKTEPLNSQGARRSRLLGDFNPLCSRTSWEEIIEKKKITLSYPSPNTCTQQWDKWQRCSTWTLLCLTSLSERLKATMYLGQGS